MTGDSAVVGPIHEALSLFSAEEPLVWSNPDASQIETVGIPARLDSRICVGESVGVQSASFVEKFKALVIEMHERTAQCAREIASALPVAVINALIDAA